MCYNKKLCMFLAVLFSFILVLAQSPILQLNPEESPISYAILNSTAENYEGYTISGSIKPDFTYTAASAPLILSGFIVEIPGTSISAVSDSTGLFELMNIPQGIGVSDIKISKKSFLTRIIGKVSITSNLLTGSVEMWAGDLAINGIQDNSINMADVLELSKCFNTVNTDLKYKADYDLNKDNSINMSDIMILVKHFNKISSDYPPVNIITVTPTPTPSAATPTSTPTATSTPTPTTGPVIVTFPDPNLEKAIRGALNKPTGTIYKSNLETLTTLDFTSKGISNISGIEYCINLTYLKLAYNSIKEISQLKYLVKLDTLYLCYNPAISDISVVGTLKNLTHFEATGDQISDISPLSALINMNKLELDKNRITNISPLCSLTKLDWIDLNTNSIKDLSPISSHTAIKMLDVTSNGMVIKSDGGQGTTNLNIIRNLISKGAEVKYTTGNIVN